MDRRRKWNTKLISVKDRYNYRFFKNDFPSTGNTQLDEVYAVNDLELYKQEGSIGYELLCRYFMSGFILYASDDYCRAFYPGAHSCYNLNTDSMEGASRVYPLISAWISSGRETRLKVLGEEYCLIDVLKKGVLAGTDPENRVGWGKVRDYDQKIAEASDIALSLWISREAVWSAFNDKEKRQVLNWLNQCVDKRVVDNNWHLFVSIINAVLESLGGGERCTKSYRRIKEFYVGDGWFSDGMNGAVDYYNAWSFHYSLYWLDMIWDGADKGYCSEVLGLFLDKYKYFFCEYGYPVFGRSVCYRTSAACPLLISVLNGDACIDPCYVRSVFDKQLDFFIRNEAVVEGRLTQGYFQDDYRYLDQYSGPASPLWGARGLVLALMIDKSNSFWNGQKKKMYVASKGYEIEVKPLNNVLVGDSSSGHVSFKKDQHKPTYNRKYTLKDLLLGHQKRKRKVSGVDLQFYTSKQIV